MKNLKSIAVALVVAFGTLTATAQTQDINTSKSKIKWVGEKVTGQHEGTIKFSTGALIFNNGNLVSGKFSVDMNSIEVTDLKAGEGKEKLEGHLKADDFFGTNIYPVSSLNFTSVKKKSANVYTVKADLTIKNITKPVQFDLKVADGVATTQFDVDRTKYGIEYKSGSIFDGLGDKVIYDDFKLTVTLYY